MEKLPFIPKRFYQRKEIHDLYGGNRQSGISPSAKYPYIFIFSGKSGENYGYKDGWDNPNIFSYTGEGQIGDMQFNKGNLALKEHINNEKRVFLFESAKTGFVEFVSELELFDVDYFDTLDVNGTIRIGIKFFFMRIGAFVPVSVEQFKSIYTNEPTFEYGKIISPNITERTGLVTSRIGQGAYRKRVIHRWEYQCAVTKFDKLEILIASHIVPWSKSTNEERLDVHNGILLSPTFDALFDRHLITFETNGNIVLSNQIEKKAFNRIGVTGEEKIENLSDYNKIYLEKHNQAFSK